MDSFLLWIGAYNALGSLVLLLFLNARLGELVLGRYIQVLARPYSHGEHGPLFIVWAATTNSALGILMVLARQWPPVAQQQVVLVVCAVYIAVGAAGLIAVVRRSPRWRASGVLFSLMLWVLQVGWGLHAAFSTPG